MSISPETLLPLREVARRIGVSIRQVYRLIAEGVLRTVPVGRRSTRIPESEVVEYIEKLKRQRPPGCAIQTSNT
jgi:excisionase family DNA binding protein